MSKYALIGGYTPETWARFVKNPGDRAAQIRKLAETVGAQLDSIYWTFGEDDFLVIIDAPDDATAAALSVGAGSSGALRGIRTIKLITSDELAEVFKKAKTVAAAYVPPGAREPVGAAR